MVQSRSDTTMSRGRSEEVPVATFSAVPCSVFAVALAHTNVFADLAFLASSAASRVRGGLRCAAKRKSGPPGRTVHQIGRHFRSPAHNFAAKRGEDTRGACARDAMAQSVRESVRTRIDVRSISLLCRLRPCGDKWASSPAYPPPTYPATTCLGRYPPRHLGST
jgi:hypothetical protein